jgi:recombination protein RecA
MCGVNVWTTCVQRNVSVQTTSGGMALKFYASQRIDVRRKDSLTDASALKEAPAKGIRIRAKVVKNKTAPPGGEAMFELRYDRGLDKVLSTVDGAVLAGVVEKRASYYYYHASDGTEVSLGQGKNNAVKVLEQDTVLREKIHTEALKRLQDANHDVLDPADETSDDESVAGRA